MKSKFLLTATIFALSFFCCRLSVKAQASVDVESGAVFTGYNNVRIPGNTGTLFPLKNDLNPEPNAFFRIRAGYTINSRHTISFLYAPLHVNSNGSTNKQITFEGVNVPSNTALDAGYQFNSYRITYRYDIVKKAKIEFGLGFTAKIRDAEIALRSQGLAASKKNVGFVPLINFRLHWKMSNNVGILLEGDALAAPQGRAEDVQLAGTYKLSDQFLLRFGYRILEGGAANDEVCNFTLFHYASVGATYTFKKKLKPN